MANNIIVANSAHGTPIINLYNMGQAYIEHNEISNSACATCIYVQADTASVVGNQISNSNGFGISVSGTGNVDHNIIRFHETLVLLSSVLICL